MYAIVDIETTGGYASNNAITEVAIVLHDGNREVKRYESLVNPGMAIPQYVQVLTGINDATVADAPYFDEIAPVIYEWLCNATFVAHNVNFDYSFLRHQLKACGLELDTPKLCTVRLSRKVFPGAASYSLGNICRHLGIEVSNRHRAGGDVDATVLLFERILAEGGVEQVRQMLKGHSREHYLPANLPAAEVERLPVSPGVYYFHDMKGKVIYVGKAKNIRQRVSSHFSNNKPGRQKQDFLRHIYSISYEVTGTELMAFLLECIEIRRLWPAYNRSLKKFEQTYGLYVYEDRSGYARLIVEKQKRQLTPVYTFCLLHEGQSLLRKLIRQFGLCMRLCYLQKADGPCDGVADGSCRGACVQGESAAVYNKRVEQAVEYLVESLPSFTLMDDGRHADERSCILVEKGRIYGMGYLPLDIRLTDAGMLKGYLTPYPENDYMRGLVYQYVERWPAKKIHFTS